MKRLVATAELPLLHQEIEVIIVPGVSAVQAAASVLGAPLMHDFAVISLSDLMTPWGAIRKRLQAAADADFVVALYNPRSKGRVSAARRGTADSPVPSLRRQPGRHCPQRLPRRRVEKVVTTLGRCCEHDIDMFSIVIIGNSATFVDAPGRMVTPRGYEESAKGAGLKARENLISPEPCSP